MRRVLHPQTHHVLTRCALAQESDHFDVHAHGHPLRAMLLERDDFMSLRWLRRTSTGGIHLLSTTRSARGFSSCRFFLARCVLCRDPFTSPPSRANRMHMLHHLASRNPAMSLLPRELTRSSSRVQVVVARRLYCLAVCPDGMRACVFWGPVELSPRSGPKQRTDVLLQATHVRAPLFEHFRVS